MIRLVEDNESYSFEMVAKYVANYFKEHHFIPNDFKTIQEMMREYKWDWYNVKLEIWRAFDCFSKEYFKVTFPNNSYENDWTVDAEFPNDGWKSMRWNEFKKLFLSYLK